MINFLFLWIFISFALYGLAINAFLLYSAWSEWSIGKKKDIFYWDHLNIPDAGFKLQAGAIWFGVHYSRHNKRWCFTFIPCVTFWFTLYGGRRP